MDITQGVPFDTFGLSEATMRAIRNKGYTISTPVQAGCIPPMLAGKDVIAKAPTGTGKTMAFGLPIIERMDRESEAVQALILAPTRELAMQITQELREVAVYHEGLRVVCLYGGEPIGKQINALKRKPQIVVATPGRGPPVRSHEAPYRHGEGGTDRGAGRGRPHAGHGLHPRRDADPGQDPEP